MTRVNHASVAGDQHALTTQFASELAQPIDTVGPDPFDDPVA